MDVSLLETTERFPKGNPARKPKRQFKERSRIRYQIERITPHRSLFDTRNPNIDLVGFCINSDFIRQVNLDLDIRLGLTVFTANINLNS